MILFDTGLAADPERIVGLHVEKWGARDVWTLYLYLDCNETIWSSYDNEDKALEVFQRIFTEVNRRAP